MALLTPPDPTEEVAQPALRPRSPTAEDPHPMIYTTCRGATPITWGRIADIASRRDTCERRRDVETDQVFVPARACRRELYRLFVMKRGERLTTRCSAWA